MPSAFSSTRDSSEKILCFYANQTSHPQMTRISHLPDELFERVLFPGQSLLFETEIDAFLEVHHLSCASSILKAEISCETLRVSDELITSLLNRLT